MDRISLSLARNTISDDYEDDIKAAAGDAVLDENEQKQLSPWANKVLDKLRTTTSGPLKTKDAYQEVDGKVYRALKAVSADKQTITKAEAKNLYVTELRTKVLDLFAPKNQDTKALEKAIDATDIPEMTDYNKGFQLQSYGAGSTLAEIAEDLTGEEMGDESWLALKKDKKAVEKFVAMVRDTAETEEENADSGDDPALGKKLRKLYDAVADEVEALFGDKSEFVEHYYHYNGIEEDGATEWGILVGKRTDGTFSAVTYSNFPF